MSLLSWGKPKIEFGVSVGGAQAASWTEMPEIVDGTTQLTTEDGEVTEAREEGGGIVDVKRDRSKFSLTFTIFMKKGDTLPIADDDGVIIADYSVRVTPEDVACTGFVLDCCTVSVQKTFSSADGYRVQYTFDAKKTATGNMFKAYVQPASSGTGD